MIPAAYALLNLDALTHNLQVAKQHAPDAKIMAVIKANAYGHGLLRVAEVLRRQVDAVAVARVDEGVRLRKAGFDKPVTVLEGFVCADELKLLDQYGLDAVIHCFEQIEMLRQRHGPGKISVWLKLDVGMNRLGFKGADFHQAYRHLRQCFGINQPPRLITHLAYADDLNDSRTSPQVALFNEAVKDYPGERSVANSAAILGWPDALADWVRPGIMLFGCSPFVDREAWQLNLKPVMSLHSRLIAVKPLAAGEAVGYGGDWVCEKATRLGVVAIGYGDGYPRYAKSGTPVLVNGKVVPMVGRVSMDMITVDLQSQPDAKPGDPVTLWGEGLAIEKIAMAADTIPYTLLCGITQRVQIIERA
ncbi:alanine racemase [Methylomarinum sp. Ch1-1]|uniref:Alanine racemase n=1 Tax=Methylomarinum roseum TaxID=3067653 RepID=A0AAU7NTK0_9GAMM|nr:alanine racemase [Methylomarinum sp. Ch1-1]MDP4519617.1 alanine racemase [Methylomarinum sp. Ch1-1]